MNFAAASPTPDLRAVAPRCATALPPDTQVRARPAPISLQAAHAAHIARRAARP